MAARRAAAKAAAAVAEQPPPPVPEPTPEPLPEPKPKEPEKLLEKSSFTEDDAKRDDKYDIKPKGKVTERVIERIIICPGGQNPYVQSPPMQPAQGHCHCMHEGISKDKKVKQKKSKGKPKKDHEEDGLCNHPFCIVQRAKIKPQGNDRHNYLKSDYYYRLPWASGMYNYQLKKKPEISKAPVVICQSPLLYCCHQCNPPDDSSESEDEEPAKDVTESHMTFMNMVFAAANVMNERPGVF